MIDDALTALPVFAARTVLVSLGCLTLDAYLDRNAIRASLMAFVSAVTAIWIDRQVLGESSNSAAVGSVAGIVAANYLMTRRKARKMSEQTDELTSKPKRSRVADCVRNHWDDALYVFSSLAVTGGAWQYSPALGHVVLGGFGFVFLYIASRGQQPNGISDQVNRRRQPDGKSGEPA